MRVWALLLLAGCARSQVVPVPPATGVPGLTVTLGWSAPVDLDLYVTEPGLETAYYALPRTRAGGVLEADARCADGAAGGGRERVHWTDPPPGGYRVGVDFPEPCRGQAQDVPYRVAVELDGRLRVFDGHARLGVREPRAIEFVVPERRTGDLP
jgi:uncharacterized protein YfaP (DUF2135 family)